MVRRRRLGWSNQPGGAWRAQSLKSIMDDSTYLKYEMFNYIFRGVILNEHL